MAGIDVLAVFISYASEDYAAAKRLHSALRRRGIDPWLDDELRPGGEWNDAIVSEDRRIEPLPRSDLTAQPDRDQIRRSKWQSSTPGCANPDRRSF